MITLTQHQLGVAAEVMYDLNKHHIALLSGISGVGKTTTTDYIIQQYKNKYKKIWIAATTHKALEVISKHASAKDNTSTLHSFLNMIPDRSGPNKPMIVDKKKQNRITNLLIVDEYSMMTKDVIDALKEYRKLNKIDILFVGDASQLVLNQKDIDGLIPEEQTSYLTESMRHGRMSDIAIYSKMVSAFILGKGNEPIVPYGDEIIKYESHKDFIRAWKKCKADNKAILAFKNNTVKAYNNNIAKLNRHQANEYEIGNRVVLRSMVRTQNRDRRGGEIFIPNRRTVTILEIEDKENYWHVKSDEGTFLINKTAKWLNEKLQPLLDTMSWNEYYKEKELYTQVHHADALTVYGAQGSTYDEVFIDATDMMTAKENVRRMAYVGISRAKEKAHIFIGARRDYKYFKPEITDV